MRIRLVRHNEINFLRWDECISKSINGIVYAYSWYLNIIAGEWDALIGDDYDSVLPLVHKKKYGINYLYQPFFAQQLGIFCLTRVDNDIVNQFVSSIPNYYKYQTISFNTLINIESPLNIRSRVTYQLDLIQPYFAISSKYNENSKRNISKALAMGVSITKGLAVDEFVVFKKSNLTTSLMEEYVEMISQITKQSVEKGLGEIFAAYSPQNELCAAALFIKSNGKAIYLFAASNETGKKNRAMFALIDRFIFENSESPIVLDFEGSEIDSIARFYAGFGASPSKYQKLTINRLPWFLKFFKR